MNEFIDDEENLGFMSEKSEENQAIDPVDLKNELAELMDNDSGSETTAYDEAENTLTAIGTINISKDSDNDKANEHLDEEDDDFYEETGDENESIGSFVNLANEKIKILLKLFSKNTPFRPRNFGEYIFY